MRGYEPTTLWNTETGSTNRDRTSFEATEAVRNELHRYAVEASHQSLDDRLKHYETPVMSEALRYTVK